MPASRRPPSQRRRALAGRLYEGSKAPDWLDTKLLRAGQVALLFQVSRRTVSDWARAGLLPSIVTPGGHRRFRARDVRAVLDRVRSGEGAAAGGKLCGPPPRGTDSRPPQMRHL